MHSSSLLHLLALISLASCVSGPQGLHSSRLTTQATVPIATPAASFAATPSLPAPQIGAPRAIVVDYASGQVLYDGLDFPQLDHQHKQNIRTQIGMLFQGGALFDSLPVWQNVAFRLMRGALKRPKEEAREIAIEKLRRVGLKPDVADRLPAELSGGMQKRVSLARAIAAEPEIIFFDEPTTGLDPIMSGVINDLIREIVTEMGATAMTITHDMPSVRAIADTVAMLHGGKIRWTGPVSEMDACNDPYVDQFIHGRPTGPIETLR